jgi:hypothetical protein
VSKTYECLALTDAKIDAEQLTSETLRIIDRGDRPVFVRQSIEKIGSRSGLLPTFCNRIEGIPHSPLVERGLSVKQERRRSLRRRNNQIPQHQSERGDVAQLHTFGSRAGALGMQAERKDGGLIRVRVQNVGERVIKRTCHSSTPRIGDRRDNIKTPVFLDFPVGEPIDAHRAQYDSLSRLGIP